MCDPRPFIKVFDGGLVLKVYSSDLGMSTAGHVDTSGRQKVSGQERFYRKNSRFHTKIFHQGKFAKIQTLHRTTENSKGTIFYIQISAKFLISQE